MGKWVIVVQSCPALCSLVDNSTPGFPVLRHLLELAQTHVHQVSDVIQPSRPLLLLPSISPASGSFLMSWFFASGGQSIRASASVLPINIQDWFPLGFDWRCLEETKTGYLPCFCCYFHLRPNKGLVVNSSTGAHLSLASGNAKRRLADCKCPTWSPSISHCNVSWILALAGRFFTADIIYYYIKYELLRVIRVGECSC